MPVWLGRRFPLDQLVSGGTWPQLPGLSSGCEDKLCLRVRVATFCPLLLLPLAGQGHEPRPGQSPARGIWGVSIVDLFLFSVARCVAVCARAVSERLPVCSPPPSPAREEQAGSAVVFSCGGTLEVAHACHLLNRLPLSRCIFIFIVMEKSNGIVS